MADFKITDKEGMLNKNEVAKVTITPTAHSGNTEEHTLIIKGSDGSTVRTVNLKLTAKATP